MTGKRLRHLAEVNPPTPEFERLPDDAPVTFIPLEAVWPGAGLDVSRSRPKHEVSHGYTRFREGDIIVPKITPTFEANRSTIAKGLPGGIAAGTTELHVVRPSLDLDVRYAGYLLSSKPFLDEGKATMVGVAGQKRVPDGYLRDLAVPVLDVGVQRTIARYLDAETTRIDALIEKKRRLARLLYERWIGHVIEATHESEPNDAGSLRRLFDDVIGGTWGDEPGEGDIDALCIRGTDFDTDTLSVHLDRAPTRGLRSSEFRRRRLRDGDLIVEKSGGGDNQPVGRVVEWRGDSAAVPTNFAARLRPVPHATSRYLAYAFRAAYESGLTRVWIKQTTGIQNLDLGGLLSERWSVPRQDRQGDIAAELDRHTRQKERAMRLLDSQIDLLQERRRALITAAVTGNLPGVAA